MTMVDYPLEPWEHFTARGQVETGEIVEAQIRHVWTVQLAPGGSIQIYGAGSDGPLWLRPQDVPSRVLRGDTSTPRHPDEWHRIFAESRDRWQNDRDRKPTDDEKLAAKLIVVEPEVRARPATLGEIPQGAKNVGVRATKAGFAVDARYARGPRFDQYWNVVEQSDTILIRGRHADGRRFGAMWLCKTGETGKSAGVKKWGLEAAHTLQGAAGWQPCNATELSAYLLTSE